MLTDEQLIDELRRVLDQEAASVTPAPGLLAQVQAGLAEPARGPRRRRLRRGGVVTAMSAMATVAVVALALVLVHSGPSPRPAAGGGAYAPPHSGLAATAADPQGGRPWILRFVPGAHGATCVQVARQPSSGPFIPMLEDCGSPDAHGHAFFNVFAQQMAAFDGARACPRGHRTGCRLSSLRNLAYGLLGPDAVSVTFKAAGYTFLGPHPRGTITYRTGPAGAYLVVLPATSRSCVLAGGGEACNSGAVVTRTTALESGALTEVIYKHSICRLPAPSPLATKKRSCPRVGFVARGGS